MKLKYFKTVPIYYERTPDECFVRQMRLIDNNLDVAFNRATGKWEIYRLTNKGYEWIHCVENEDESYRPLDNRTLAKLREMDIIARYGSVRDYERHMDDKQKEWQRKEQERIDHELKYDIKDNKLLWDSAKENAQYGRVNEQPVEQSKKIISYQK